MQHLHQSFNDVIASNVQLHSIPKLSMNCRMMLQFLVLCLLPTIVMVVKSAPENIPEEVDLASGIIIMLYHQRAGTKIVCLYSQKNNTIVIGIVFPITCSMINNASIYHYYYEPPKRYSKGYIMQ